jgi:transposase InsO family protein
MTKVSWSRTWSRCATRGRVNALATNSCRPCCLWTLKVGPQEMTFTALTIIDMVTNLVEVVRLDNKASAHVALQFENTWLARYPLPQHCVYDQGGEFIGWPFQQVLLRHQIAGHPTTAKNPQANSVCERMHQSIGNS